MLAYIKAYRQKKVVESYWYFCKVGLRDSFTGHSPDGVLALDTSVVIKIVWEDQGGGAALLLEKLQTFQARSFQGKI